MKGNAGQVREAIGARASGRRAAVRRVIASKPSSRRARTQSQLLKAGRELIVEKGIGATSVGDICGRAGFSRGAFYSNFTDIDHFVRRLADEQWEQMTGFVRSAVAQALPPDREESPQLSEAQVAAALAGLSDQLLRAMPASQDFYLLQSELAAYIVRDVEHAPTLREGYGAFKASLKDLLVCGLEAVGRRTLASPEDTTELLFAAADRSMRLALTGQGQEGLTAFLERVLPLLLTRLSEPLEQ